MKCKHCGAKNNGQFIPPKGDREFNHWLYECANCGMVRDVTEEEITQLLTEYLKLKRASEQVIYDLGKGTE